jgi:hypothetical protein
VNAPFDVVVPDIVSELFTVEVPVPAPILSVVAAPAKLTVVAVVLTKAKVVEPVVRLVVIAGEVPKTATPDPVSSDMESMRTEDRAVVVRLLDASVKSILEAVMSAKLTTPVPESMTIFPVVVPPKVNVFMAVLLIVAVPYNDKAPEIDAVPLTSNFARGLVVPMPTLPSFLIVTLSPPL